MSVLAIDLGNWNIKTSEGDIFPSRYTKVENILGTTADILEYQGVKYYIGDGNLENNYDKASKETNVILFLYALAKQPDISFKVVVGLPVASYKANRDNFRDKLLENKVHSVKLNGVSKTLIIEDLIVFPEGAGTYYSLSKERCKNAIIVDVGGGTTNIVSFKNGKLNKSTTLGQGMIEFYNKIREYLNSKYTLKLDLKDIESIIQDGLSVDGEKVDFNFLKTIVDDFIAELMNELRQFDIRTSQVYLSGGGIKVFKNLLRKNIKGSILVEDYLFSNVRGFKKIGVSKWKERE